MPQSARLALACIVLGFAPPRLVPFALGQRPAPAEIRGRVITRFEVPIPSAEVTVLGDSLSALTDSGGRFVLRGVRPGEHVVRVRRVGFQAEFLAATLAAGERKEVLIALGLSAHQLPEIEVTARLAKPIEYAWTTKYDDFFRRQRVGLGRYITRKEIDRKAATQTAELLLGVPGVRVQLGAPGWSPTTIRCTRATFRKTSVWIDGAEVRWSDFFGDDGPGELVNRVLPLQIEMIEVYTGPARMQAEFLGDSDCAIVIWTR